MKRIDYPPLRSTITTTMKQLKIIRQHKNKVIIVAVPVVAVLSLALALLLSDDGQTPATRNIRIEQPSQSVPDTTTEQPVVNRPDEETATNRDAAEVMQDPEQSVTDTTSNVSVQKPSVVTTEEPSSGTEPDNPAETQPEQTQQSTPPDEDPATLAFDSQIPDGIQPDRPVTSQNQAATPQRRIVLSRGPCLVQSTSAHPYAGWPMLHFERMGITVSESSSGRTLGTLLNNSHTGDWGSGSITVSASKYCNDNIRHRHLVNSSTSCANLSPGHWTNVPFEDVELGEYGGWCYRDIPRSSWGN